MDRDFSLASSLIGAGVTAVFIGTAKAIIMVLDWRSGAINKERITAIAEFKILFDERKKEIDELRKIAKEDMVELKKELIKIKEEHSECANRLDQANRRIENLRHILIRNGIDCPEDDSVEVEYRHSEKERREDDASSNK